MISSSFFPRTKTFQLIIRLLLTICINTPCRPHRCGFPSARRRNVSSPCMRGGEGAITSLGRLIPSSFSLPMTIYNIILLNVKTAKRYQCYIMRILSYQYKPNHEYLFEYNSFIFSMHSNYKLRPSSCSSYILFRIYISKGLILIKLYSEHDI